MTEQEIRRDERRKLIRQLTLIRQSNTPEQLESRFGRTLTPEERRFTREVCRTVGAILCRLTDTLQREDARRSPLPLISALAVALLGGFCLHALPALAGAMLWQSLTALRRELSYLRRPQRLRPSIEQYLDSIEERNHHAS